MCIFIFFKFRNCNHFSSALCKRLVGKDVPGWVNRAARVGGGIGLGEVVPSDKEVEERKTSKFLADSKANEKNLGKKAAHVSLIQKIKMDESECLNEDSDETFKKMIEKRKCLLKSDCDEQLLIKLPFSVPVNISKISAIGPEDSRPLNVQLFVNKPNLTFDDVENCKPSQSLVLGEEKEHNLNVAKFKNVQQITIFVVDNNGGSDQTIIESFDLIGTYGKGMNLSDLQAKT
mmetsp:Transcript_16370/g.18199  ORF Transcript_16370/g.18199 Transcript_16370/m.18199 type:complete len:232 (+) Transcript_16370:25-720(+)